MYTYDELFDQRSVVAARLEGILNERQITKTQLCKETGVSRPTIDKVLSGAISSKANFDKHLRKILEYLQLTPDMLMGISAVRSNQIRRFRNLLRKKIEDFASATGIDVERLKAIEAGEEATPAELRDIALSLYTGTRCIMGDWFFEPQIATLNDFLLEDNEVFNSCGYWGHIGILPAGTNEHIWFPITESVHRLIYQQIYRMKRIVVPCMNNKVLLLNLDNIKQVLFLDDACDEPGFTNWDSSVDCGNYPLVIYEALEDFLFDEAEAGVEQMSAAFREVMERIAAEEGWNKESVMEKQQTIVWYRDGKKSYTSMISDGDSSLISEIETLYEFEDDQFSEDYLEYDEECGAEIMINMKEVSLVELPLVQVEEAICHSRETDNDLLNEESKDD